MHRDILGFGVTVLAACLLGLCLNAIRAKPLPLVYQSKAERLDQGVLRIASASPSPAPTASAPRSTVPKQLGLEEFKEYALKKQGVLIDARPEIFHRMGHVPGAIALPRDDFEAFYPKVRELLERDKGQPLVIYCSGDDCEDSELVREALAKLGFTQIGVFLGGWNKWNQAKLPVEKAT